METLLVHEAIAAAFLPLVAGKLREAGVVIRGCEKTRAILPDAEAATEEDWYREYLDLILAVRVVRDLDEAIAHIETYGSLHTEAIVTESYERAQRFLQRGQLLDGPRQRLHPLQRRLRTGAGGGDRHQHDQAPRLRADGAGRADDDQIHHLRKRQVTRHEMGIVRGHV